LTKEKYMDIQLLTNLKLRGAHVGFREKTQNDVDDLDVERSLPQRKKPGYDPRTRTATASSCSFITELRETRKPEFLANCGIF
jgi:hypothetical protein